MSPGSRICGWQYYVSCRHTVVIWFGWNRTPLPAELITTAATRFRDGSLLPFHRARWLLAQPQRGTTRRPSWAQVLLECSSGWLLPVGADDLLGLTIALLPLGTTGIVASLIRSATSLHSGASRAQTLHDARATALSVVVLGAGWRRR